METKQKTVPLKSAKELLSQLNGNDPLSSLFDLVDLAKTEQGRSEIGEEGIREIVSFCSKTSDQDLLEAGTRVLINLAFDNDQIQKAILKEPTWGFLKKYLSDSNTLGLNCILVLENLSSNVELQAQMADHELFEILLSNVAKFRPFESQALASVKTLSNFHKNEIFQKCFQKQDGLAALVNCILSTNYDLMSRSIVLVSFFSGNRTTHNYCLNYKEQILKNFEWAEERLQ